MKLEYLYALIAVHDEKTITRASEKLDLSDKTVHKYLNNLEEEIGVKLTTRSSRGVEFTEEGEAFYLYATNTIATLDSFKNNIVKENKEYVIAAEIRTFFTGIINCSEKVIEKYHVNFLFKELYREEILKGLVDKKYDLGIITMDKGIAQSLANNNLEFVEVSKRNTVAIVKNTHPLANKKEVSLRELKEYKRIVFENPFDDYYNYYHDIEKEYDLMRSNIMLNYLGDVELILKNTTCYYLGGITQHEENILPGLKAIRISEMKEQVAVGYVHNKDVILDNVIQNLIFIVTKALNNP